MFVASIAKRRGEVKRSEMIRATRIGTLRVWAIRSVLYPMYRSTPGSPDLAKFRQNSRCPSSNALRAAARSALVSPLIPRRSAIASSRCWRAAVSAARAACSASVAGRIVHSAPCAPPWTSSAAPGLIVHSMPARPPTTLASPSRSASAAPPSPSRAIRGASIPSVATLTTIPIASAGAAAASAAAHPWRIPTSM